VAASEVREVAVLGSTVDAREVPGTARPRTTLATWCLAAVPVAVLAQRAWALRWMNDDGVITLRVVSKLLGGHGPVFNAGERVESSTSALWVLVLSVGDVVLPLPLERIAIGLGMALTLVGVVLALLAARSLVAELHPGAVAVPVGMVVFVAVKPVWIFSSSGLEGGLVTAWLGACAWLLQRWSRGAAPLPWLTAVVVGLGPLIRPELAIYTVALLGAVLLAHRHNGWRAELRIVAWAAALPVAYQVFRMGYYGVLVPNTAIAKEASRSRWDLGWDYLRNFVDPYWLWLPLLVLAATAAVPLVSDLRRTGRRRHLLVAGAFVLGAAVQTLYVVRLGGDYIEARLLLPAFFAVLVPVAVVPVQRRYLASLLVVPWAVVSVLFLRSAIDDASFANRNLVTIDDYGWGRHGGVRQRDFSGEPGVYYNGRRLPGVRPQGDHDVVYASFGVGVSGYALRDVYVLDMLGLGDPVTAHFRLEERGLSGHEKNMSGPWFVARATEPGTELDADDIGPFPLPFPAFAMDHDVTAPFAERVADARTAIRCEKLEDFVESYTEPLTVGRFLRNIVDSFHNTALRIPFREREAVDELCR
jgi:arabinofuranosyltransferase